MRCHKAWIQRIFVFNEKFLHRFLSLQNELGVHKNCWRVIWFLTLTKSPFLNLFALKPGEASTISVKWNVYFSLCDTTSRSSLSDLVRTINSTYVHIFDLKIEQGSSEWCIHMYYKRLFIFTIKASFCQGHFWLTL